MQGACKHLALNFNLQDISMQAIFCNNYYSPHIWPVLNESMIAQSVDNAAFNSNQEVTGSIAALAASLPSLTDPLAECE